MSQSNDLTSRKTRYVDPATFTPYFTWAKSGARNASVEEVVCERASLESIARKSVHPETSGRDGKRLRHCVRRGAAPLAAHRRERRSHCFLWSGQGPA